MPLGYKERLHKLELELTEKCTADGAWVEPKGNTLGIRVDPTGENFSKSFMTFMPHMHKMRVERELFTHSYDHSDYPIKMSDNVIDNNETLKLS